ncbi:MAG TPA: hypothetical protein VK176_00525 [Phycisphaerales bacterium]|nr:hypothetical protein [Phycisphaerales bacterium]
MNAETRRTRRRSSIVSTAVLCGSLWLLGAAIGPVGKAHAQETLALSRYNQRDPSWRDEIELVRNHFALDQEQLSILRTITSGSMYEHMLQRRLYDRRREDYESRMEEPKVKDLNTAENQRFAARRAAIEKDWLLQVRDVILTPEQLTRWSTYERARRVSDLIQSQLNSQLEIDSLLHEMKLTDQERAAVEPSVDTVMQSLDVIARKYLDATGKWLQARWGVTSGDLQQLEAAQAQSVEKLSETLKTGVRTIAGSLSPERGDELRTRFEVLFARNEMYMTDLTDRFPFDSLVKISTLSTEQHRRLVELVSDANAAIYKRVRKFVEDRNATRISDENADYQNLLKMRESYQKDENRIQRETYESMIAVLTAEQRKAFEEGREPRIEENDLLDQFEEQDERARLEQEFEQ